MTSSTSSESVIIGYQAGKIGQQNSSVAIGPYAGNTGQGNYSIAIGPYAGRYGQPADSIILNASDSHMDTPPHSGFFVNPVAHIDYVGSFKQLYYDPTSREIVYLKQRDTN